MNKNVKRIVAMALAIGTVSAVAPATNINLLTTKAYAATNEDEELESLELETSSGSTIQLYSASGYDSDDKVDDDEVDEGDDYYAKTSSSTIKINTDGPDDDYVKVFKGTSDSTKGKDVGKSISLSEGTNVITVKIYDEEPDSDVRYDNEDEDANVVGEYTIKVKYTGSDSDSEDDTDNADDYDDIYLQKLTIAGESISLSDSKVAYTYNVASTVDEVTIKAEPDYDDYTVKIDGTEVDDGENYKKTVSLVTGENKIEVKVENEDDDEERVYTLKITRGSTSSTSTSTTDATTLPSTATTVVTTTAKTNQWLQVNGAWQYNDSTGNPVKNMWIKNYYLQADGNMATGWLNNSGSWYYLGSDGAKKTTWQSVGGAWYYLDGEGRMQTGWMKDITGKYYYLNSSGAMAVNTTVGGYKLGTDGAWIN